MKRISVLLTGIILVFSLLGCGEKRQEPPPSGGQTVPEKLIAEGSIALDPQIIKDADPLSVLFIIARTPKGPIVAVKKLFPPFQYPLAFRLTSKDLMIPGRTLPPEIQLKVRLDRDGDANPDQPGDIIGKTPDPGVPFGSTGLTIILDKKIN